MNYKGPPGMVMNTQLVFSELLELGDIDQSSLEKMAESLADVMHNPNRQSIAQKIADEMERLAYIGMVSDVDGVRRLTQEGHEWGETFRILHDDTYILFGDTIGAAAWPTFASALRIFSEYLMDLQGSLQSFLGEEHTIPPLLRTLELGTAHIRNLPNFPQAHVPSAIHRQAAVLACRAEMLRLREHKEYLETRARDRQVLVGVERKLAHLQSILDRPGLACALTTPKPRLTDFLNVGVIEEASSKRPTDEKFGILSAPTLFSPDFVNTAEGAFSRDRCFAVGFIDIDKFKDFNTEHRETVVDQDMLPHFMRALEAYCHGRAFAYRQGGDEYLVILRNADPHEARSFFEGLRAHFAQVHYPDSVTRKPTVSIGVHVIDGNHEVTEFEAKDLANAAKNAAKAAGRNCVRLSTDPPPAPAP